MQRDHPMLFVQSCFVQDPHIPRPHLPDLVLIGEHFYLQWRKRVTNARKTREGLPDYGHVAINMKKAGITFEIAKAIFHMDDRPEVQA